MEDLMDCPFCGGNPALEEIHRGDGVKTTEAMISCSTCGCSTNIEEDWLAIKIWNRRDG